MDFIAYGLWFLLELLLLYTGRLAVRVLSINRWGVESITRNESQCLAAAGALSFKRDGQRVVTCTGQQIAGLLVLALVAMTLFFAR